MSARLKVLVLPAWYPSPENPSTVSFLREHVRAVALYHDVVVLAAPREPVVLGQGVLFEESCEDGVKVVRMRYRRSRVPKTTLGVYLWSVLRAVRALAREGFRPDVIHAHFYSAALPAVVLGRVFRVPVVVTENAASFATGFSGVPLLEARLLMGMANLLIAVSESLRAQMEALGFRGTYRVIPNPVDTDVFAPDPLAKHRHPRPARLLVAARLHPVKDFPTLFEGLVLLERAGREFVLDVLGDGPCRVEYEALARSLGLGSHVVFHGFKDREAVADSMRRADVFVLTSLTENCPCVLLEAMASGLPVVASDVGGVREMVPGGMGSLFPKGDSRALAATLARTLESLDTYDPLKMAAYARSRFGLDAVGSQLDHAYRGLVAR